VEQRLVIGGEDWLWNSDSVKAEAFDSHKTTNTEGIVGAILGIVIVQSQVALVLMKRGQSNKNQIYRQDDNTCETKERNTRKEQNEKTEEKSTKTN
jgi:mannitol-specific phosphotransferase system IIBC component